jgi:transcriptional regulator with XRE-family HTH domain
MRTEAGMTVEQVAEALLVSPSKVSRLETGHRGASARDIRDLSELYGITDPAMRERLDGLASEGRKQAWWQPYDLPYATYVGLEAEATSISDFEPGVVPGLLQTPDYARAVHENVIPSLSQAVIAQRLEERRRRQLILSESNPPILRTVVDESVIHRVVGSPAVMATQLDHVVEASALSYVTVQIMPFAAGAHPALDSTFVLLGFAPPAPGVVYAEGLVGHMYLERPQDILRYRKVFERLCEMSLSPQQSIELIAKKSQAYRGQ